MILTSRQISAFESDAYHGFRAAADVRKLFVGSVCLSIDEAIETLFRLDHRDYSLHVSVTNLANLVCTKLNAQSSLCNTDLITRW